MCMHIYIYIVLYICSQYKELDMVLKERAEQAQKKIQASDD